MIRWLSMLLAAVALAGGAAAQPWVPDPLEPVSSGGLEAVDRALARLSVHARLLVVGAHPDDEDNALLTWVARGLGGEAAYLSLSRGEGGQNLIGEELGVELGVLRTGELLAARRLEGSRQYFARAYDFGYTRSLDETFERWPRELLQEDAVRIVRRFKPQVMVAVFPADERAGHGQHQASAVIAADAFELAGQVGDSLARTRSQTPWAPSALYRRAWLRFGEEPTHEYSLAALDPITGRSLGQLAAASRSFHRSQDMGREQLAGPARGGLVWIAGAGGGGNEPFAGIDTRLTAIAGTLPAGALRDEVSQLLARIEEAARQARWRLTPSAVEAVVPALAEILGLLRRCEETLGPSGPEARAVRELVAEKVEVANYGLAAAAGVVVEAVADREVVPAGGSFQVEGSVWPAGGVDVTVAEVEALVASGWRAAPLEVPAAGPEPRQVETRRYRVEVPRGAEWSVPTIPYYLRRIPRHEVYDIERAAARRKPRPDAFRLDRFLLFRDYRLLDAYDLLGAPEELLGEPLEPPPVRLRFALEIAGQPVTVVREAVYRHADQAFGERRAPVRVVPPVELSVEPEVALVAGAEGSVELTATVRSNLAEAVSGQVTMATALREERVEIPFVLAGEGIETSLPSVVGPFAAPGRHVHLASLVTDGGYRPTDSLRLVSYPHIRPLTVPVRAASLVSRFELALPRLDRVGYVRGASDRVPEILSAVGLPVELLDAEELERGELAEFDAVVIGSRAYETDAVLRRANDRLLEYVRAGGLLVVQYQQYQFVRGGFAPYPLEILRPHGRVTDETAPVELLLADHQVFRHPNRIGPDDWEGWVQERGLYFAGTWDERYEPLLALADSGREAERGALLVAPLGEGAYVYTGLSFFRQLPAGVAGAIRLFVNLLALGERG